MVSSLSMGSYFLVIIALLKVDLLATGFIIHTPPPTRRYVHSERSYLPTIVSNRCIQPFKSISALNAVVNTTMDPMSSSSLHSAPLDPMKPHLNPNCKSLVIVESPSKG